jgi:hypothetical protein
MPFGVPVMLAFARRIALAALALAAFAAPAIAVETGTPAWLINGQSLFEGPGAQYDVTGELGDETRIRVDRCAPLWCKVHAEGVKGWVALSNISFGQEPRGPLTGPRLNYPSGGPGQVCFYTGTNYTGEATCGPSGFVIRDLLTAGRDNSFSSVTIGAGVSVTACRDRKFQSYCERIVKDQPVLHGFLEDGVSSIRVW